jgi:hypothetical protein
MRAVAIPMAAFFKFSHVSEVFDPESPREYDDPVA